MTASVKSEELLRAKIFELLKTPSTQKQVTAQVRAAKSRIRAAFTELTRQEKIFVSAWDSREGGAGAFAAIYSQGQGVTPPKPFICHDKRILEILPATKKEIMEKLGMSGTAVYEAIKGLGNRVSVGDQKRSERGRMLDVYFDTHAERVERGCFYPAESTTDYAIRTQPVSVWAMGAMGARA